MDISLKHYGKLNGKPSKVIDITITANDMYYRCDITNLDGFVDDNFISNLRNIADELEAQNNLVKHK